MTPLSPDLGAPCETGVGGSGQKPLLHFKKRKANHAQQSWRMTNPQNKCEFPYNLSKALMSLAILPV